MISSASRSRGTAVSVVAALRPAILIVLAGAVAAGCTTAVVPTRPVLPDHAPACVAVDTSSPDSLRVAVAHAVDPAHAPAPQNAAERLVFRQLYETLVRIDCDGNVQPALATSWSVDPAGRLWQFRLRPGARFTDGAAVTAATIAEAWSADASSAARAAAGVTGLADGGAGELRVELERPAAAHVFAEPGLAVARAVAGSAWPVGTTTWRADTTPAPRVTRLVTADASAMPRVLEFRDSPDPRAALDGGADVLITADRAVLAYARALGDYGATPLHWSRTYVLATRGRDIAADLTVPPAAALEALATSALRGAARAAEPPFLWRDPGCAVPAPPRPARPVAAQAGAGAIAYERGDADARAIAERLVALAWPAANAPAWLRALLPDDYDARATVPTAAGLDRRALLAALSGGNAARPHDSPLGVVVAVPHTAATICTDMYGAVDVPAYRLLLGPAGDWRVTPLVDTRDHIVHRAAAGRIIVDHDGAFVVTTSEP